MDARTLKALKGSIAKWEAIVAGTGTDEGPRNCPLCVEFWGDYCKGCPVRDKTGHHGCIGTPYAEWERADVTAATTPALVALAQAELDFLRSLLPEGE